MAAQFKSNVRVREEKGFGSISMKRLIFCGVGAVLIFMTLRFTPLATIALPMLLGVFAGLLVLTGPRGGLPLWHRLMLGLRGGLVVAAARHPAGIAALIARALNVDVSVAYLSQRQIFTVQSSMVADEDVNEWAVFADLNEAETTGGLHFVNVMEGSDGNTL